MRSMSFFALALLLVLGASASAAGETADRPRVFSVLRLEIDPSGAELSGWQLRADFGKSDARIVGIEGGASPAFTAPPYYDPRALNGGEIVLAALARGQELPTGRTTVAVLHVEHDPSGLPPLEVSELIAVGADGDEIEAAVIQENGAE